jgi:hypothetical protein
MAHPYRTIRRKHYGTNFTRLRHHNEGSPSSNTKYGAIRSPAASLNTKRSITPKAASKKEALNLICS